MSGPELRTVGARKPLDQCIDKSYNSYVIESFFAITVPLKRPCGARNTVQAAIVHSKCQRVILQRRGLLNVVRV